MAFAFMKKIFGKAPSPLSAEQTAALEESGAIDAAKSGKAALGGVGGAGQGNRCENGHSIYVGQRPEDCFDCHLVNLIQSEVNGKAQEQKEKVVVGALLCLGGFHQGEAFPLMMAEDEPVLLGAEPDCNIVLSDDRISRRHIAIVRRNGRLTVQDLNSLHHSAMRAEGELQWYAMDPEREYWVRDGCHIMLGDIEFLFRASDEQALKMTATES